jgi:hypothetical protein
VPTATANNYGRHPGTAHVCLIENERATKQKVAHMRAGIFPAVTLPDAFDGDTKPP